jgi:hypothetical protein
MPIRLKHPDRKEKRSYTLSADSVAFLEHLRKSRRRASTSSVLEELVQAARLHEQRLAVDRSITAYYSSLSDTDAAEQSLWGEFAVGEFPLEP